MRILCLGIGSPDDGRYVHSAFQETSPTIFDYDIVVMDLNQLSESYYRYIANRVSEFRKFFESKGVCFVIMNKSKRTGDVSNYDWCPFADEMEITNKSGETVICLTKDARPIFDSTEFSWTCFFSKYPRNATILATNRANDPISIMIPFENGYCIFLPFVNEDKRTQLLSLLIEKGLRLIEEKETGVEEEEEQIPSANLPSWATAYMSKTEVHLLKTRNEINEKLGKYNKFKALFWETGSNLEGLVIEAFEELGIEVTRLPKESHGDFEFSINEHLTGVCEVKGLMGNADRRNLRQLLDYFVEQRDIEKRNVKGILVVNHYRNEKPSERGKPVTDDAADLVETYDFHVLTALQLYEYLTMFWENKLTTNDFRKKFQD